MAAEKALSFFIYSAVYSMDWECTFFSRNSNAIINATAIGSAIHALCTNPAITYDTKDTAAATIA